MPVPATAAVIEFYIGTRKMRGDSDGKTAAKSSVMDETENRKRTSPEYAVIQKSKHLSNKIM